MGFGFIKEIEAWISIWVNRLLSRGGGLVLVRLVLESILVPLLLLSSDNRSSEGTPLVKWTSIAKSNLLGGWGLENVDLFSQSPAAKCLRPLLNNRSLWGRAMRDKYYAGNSIIDWI